MPWAIYLLIFIFGSAHTIGMQPHQEIDARIPTVNPMESTSGESCVGQCAFNFVEQMKRELGGDTAQRLLNLNYNDFLISFSNISFFEGFCKQYHTFQFCYTSCSHSYMQELLSRSAEIIDHFCVYNYKEIKKNFGCLSKLNSNVSRQCLQICTPHHDAVSSIMHNFKHLALNGDSSEAEKYLGEACEYVICTMHCDVPTIAHLCGFETANLVVDLTRKSFRSMEQMALDTGAVSRWPNVCADIKTYRLPNSPSEAPTHNETVIAEPPKLVAEAQISSSSSLPFIPIFLLFFSLLSSLAI